MAHQNPRHHHTGVRGGAVVWPGSTRGRCLPELGKTTASAGAADGSPELGKTATGGQSGAAHGRIRRLRHAHQTADVVCTPSDRILHARKLAFA